MRSLLNTLRAFEQGGGLGQVSGLHEQFAGQRKIDGPAGIGGDYPQENSFGFIRAPHPHVGLSHAGKAFYGIGSLRQAAIVCINRGAIASGEPRSVAEQKPVTCLVRGWLGHALPVLHSGSVTAALHSSSTSPSSPAG